MSKDNEKLTVMQTMAKEKDIPMSAVYYVDDSFPLILKASKKGISAEHISLFLPMKRKTYSCIDTDSIQDVLNSLENEISLLRDDYEHVNNPFGDRWDYKNPYDQVINIIDKYKFLSSM